MRRYVLLDVDGVCLDYEQRPMPGIRTLVEAFRALGYGIVLWSSGGADYCRKAATACGITIDACHAKPAYPIQERAALKLLGRPPALQIDDDPSEAVPGWMFLLVDEAEGLVRGR